MCFSYYIKLPALLNILCVCLTRVRPRDIYNPPHGSKLDIDRHSILFFFNKVNIIDGIGRRCGSNREGNGKILFILMIRAMKTLNRKEKIV